MNNRLISLIIIFGLFLSVFSTFVLAADCEYDGYIVNFGVQQNLNLNQAFQHCFPTANYDGVTIIDGPYYGNAAIIASGQQVRYTATNNAGCGLKDTITFRATSRGVEVGTIKIYIYINCPSPQNNPPVAVDDHSSTADCNTCVDVNVTSNDYDPDGDPITIVNLSTPSFGTATIINPTGGIVRFCPDSYFGTAYFDYSITDGKGGVSTARVYVEVPRVCDTIIAEDDYYSTNMNTPLFVQAPGVLINDKCIYPIKVKSVLHNVVNGILVMNEDGSFTYTPFEGFCGTDFFTYVVGTDECPALSNVATVTIEVNCITSYKLPPTSILYPGIDIIQMTVPASGDNVILGGKVVSPLEVTPGTQSLNVQVKNKGFLTQIDAGVRFEGLPQGVTFSLEPSTQKIKAHSTGTYTLTLTVPPTTPSGTYSIKAVSYSRRGITDRVEFNLIVD